LCNDGLLKSIINVMVFVLMMVLFCLDDQVPHEDEASPPPSQPQAASAPIPPAAEPPTALPSEWAWEKR